MSTKTNPTAITTDKNAKTVTYEHGARFEVFSITKGATAQRWTRLGTAFVNGDGSLNVYLEATPLDGRLHMRPPVIRCPDSSESGSN